MISKCATIGCRFTWILCSVRCAIHPKTCALLDVRASFVCSLSAFMTVYYLLSFIYLPTPHTIYLYLRIHLMRSNLFPIESHAGWQLKASESVIGGDAVSAMQCKRISVCVYACTTQRFTSCRVFSLLLLLLFLFSDEQLDLAASLRFVSVSLFMCRYFQESIQSVSAHRGRNWKPVVIWCTMPELALCFSK